MVTLFCGGYQRSVPTVIAVVYASPVLQEDLDNAMVAVV